MDSQDTQLQWEGSDMEADREKKKQELQQKESSMNMKTIGTQALALSKELRTKNKDYSKVVKIILIFYNWIKFLCGKYFRYMLDKFSNSNRRIILRQKMILGFVLEGTCKEKFAGPDNFTPMLIGTKKAIPAKFLLNLLLNTNNNDDFSMMSESRLSVLCKDMIPGENPVTVILQFEHSSLSDLFKEQLKLFRKNLQLMEEKFFIIVMFVIKLRD